jgi:exoribonuclease R
VHAPPDDEKLDQLRTTLRMLGIELQLPETVHRAIWRRSHAACVIRRAARSSNR